MTEFTPLKSCHFTLKSTRSSSSVESKNSILVLKFAFICCLFKVLAQTLANLHEAGEEKEFYQPVHTYVLNPKAITMEELYGGINKLTLEWHDGLMGLTVRHCVQVTIFRISFFSSVINRGSYIKITPD